MDDTASSSVCDVKLDTLSFASRLAHAAAWCLCHRDAQPVYTATSEKHVLVAVCRYLPDGDTTEYTSSCILQSTAWRSGRTSVFDRRTSLHYARTTADD